MTASQIASLTKCGHAHWKLIGVLCDAQKRKKVKMMSIQYRVSSVAIVLLVAMSFLQTHVLAFGPAVDNYSWVVTIETDERKQYFKYGSSVLSDVTRARVSYREGDAA